MKPENLEDDLVPYVLTPKRNLPYLELDLDIGHELETLHLESREDTEFCSLVNRSNHKAFGGKQGMGMPQWVMLDCAILPSAVVGFMLPVDKTPDEILDKLDVDEDYDGWREPRSG